MVDGTFHSADTGLRIINEIRKITTEIERCRLEIVLLEVDSQSRTQRKPNSTERMNFGADPEIRRRTDGSLTKVQSMHIKLSGAV